MSEERQGRLPEDLRQRTKVLAVQAVRLYREIPKAREVEVLAHQMLRAVTSVAANAREASRARSPEEFMAKLGLAVQEADESQLWLELLSEECGIAAAEPMHSEMNELIAIFVTIINRTRAR